MPSKTVSRWISIVAGCRHDVLEAATLASSIFATAILMSKPQPTSAAKETMWTCSEKGIDAIDSEDVQGERRTDPAPTGWAGNLLAWLRRTNFRRKPFPPGESGATIVGPFTMLGHELAKRLTSRHITALRGVPRSFGFEMGKVGAERARADHV